ncbi:DUF4132 domain-containing protein [Rhizobium leguminosarum]|nr:DUF4132 domain-containing protein [Rhizobium leguminosarum]
MIILPLKSRPCLAELSMHLRGIDRDASSMARSQSSRFSNEANRKVLLLDCRRYRCAWPDPKEGFGQHPLLRPDGRNLDPEKVWSLTEDAAYGLFVDFRWADNSGNPYCPRCGCLEPWVCKFLEANQAFVVIEAVSFFFRELSCGRYYR